MPTTKGVVSIYSFLSQNAGNRLFIGGSICRFFVTKCRKEAIFGGELLEAYPTGELTRDSCLNLLEYIFVPKEITKMILTLFGFKNLQLSTCDVHKGQLLKHVRVHF